MDRVEELVRSMKTDALLTHREANARLAAQYARNAERMSAIVHAMDKEIERRRRGDVSQD